MSNERIPTIYCFLDGGSPGWYEVMAIAEDGTILATHISSSPTFFHHDIGITSTWKRDKYKNHYPNGYRLEWVEREDIASHEKLQKAFAAFELQQVSAAFKAEDLV